MSKYYVLDFEVYNDDYYAIKGEFSDESIFDLFVDGVSLKNKEFSILFKKNKGNVRNMIGNLYSLPIISEPIADILLRNCPIEIELFEVKVDVKTTFKYYFLNILNVVECIDLEKSVYSLFAPEVLVFKTIDRMVFDTDKINKDVFRIKGLRTKMIISEKIKKEIQALNFEEIKLISIDDYKWK